MPAFVAEMNCICRNPGCPNHHPVPPPKFAPPVRKAQCATCGAAIPAPAPALAPSPVDPRLYAATTSAAGADVVHSLVLPPAPVDV